MRRTALIAATLLLAACGSDPAQTDPDPVTAEEFIGAWTVYVAEAADCWDAFQLHYDVSVADVHDHATETTFSFEDPLGWYAGSTANRYPLRFAANGSSRTFTLQFGAGTPTTYADFGGSNPTSQRMEGTFSDPNGVFKTKGGTHPCLAVALALRTS